MPAQRRSHAAISRVPSRALLARSVDLAARGKAERARARHACCYTVCSRLLSTPAARRLYRISLKLNGSQLKGIACSGQLASRDEAVSPALLLPGMSTRLEL